MTTGTANRPMTNAEAVSVIQQIIAGGSPQPQPQGPVDPPRIRRGGKEIILPEDMSYGQARDWLTKQEQAEEKIVEVVDIVPCAPLDGVVALSRAVKEMFGFTELTDRTIETMFGSKKAPPQLIQVPTPNGIETAVIGELNPPMWEGGFVTAEIGMAPEVRISGKIKRKFEPQLKELIKLVRVMLKEKSIYRGQAIYVDLGYIREQRPFHPIQDAPQFMALGDRMDLILNKQTDFELSTSLFMLLERSEECASNRISLKHGVLLSGSYGTGKTLTARVVAQKAVSNKWTFIYLKNAYDLAEGLRVAQLYTPAVVFAEDVDQVVKGDRDEELNHLLNTLDGVDTKDKPIITVLTTNHPELIQPAFIRAGRIDTVIRFTPPDHETCLKFVQMYAKDDEGRSLLRPDEDLTEAGKVLAGMVPAFICEAVAKAKRYAIYRDGNDIVGKITGDDLCLAGTSIKDHIAMAEQKREPDALERYSIAYMKYQRAMADQYANR